MLEKYLKLSYWVSINSVCYVFYFISIQVINSGEIISKKCKVHPCTGTEALYRPYGP